MALLNATSTGRVECVQFLYSAQWDALFAYAHKLKSCSTERYIELDIPGYLDATTFMEIRVQKFLPLSDRAYFPW